MRGRPLMVLLAGLGATSCLSYSAFLEKKANKYCEELAKCNPDTPCNAPSGVDTGYSTRRTATSTPPRRASASTAPGSATTGSRGSSTRSGLRPARRSAAIHERRRDPLGGSRAPKGRQTRYVAVERDTAGRGHAQVRQGRPRRCYRPVLQVVRAHVRRRVRLGVLRLLRRLLRPGAGRLRRPREIADCRAVVGPEVAAQAEGCKIIKRTAELCIDQMQTVECPLDGGEIDDELPASCAQVWKKCKDLPSDGGNDEQPNG